MTHTPAKHAEHLAGKSQDEANAYLATLTANQLAELIAECQQVIEEETQRTAATNSRPSWTAYAHQELIDQATTLQNNHPGPKKESTP